MIAASSKNIDLLFDRLRMVTPSSVILAVPQASGIFRRACIPTGSSEQHITSCFSGTIKRYFQVMHYSTAI
jgi:hypothetical protein